MTTIGTTSSDLKPIDCQPLFVQHGYVIRSLAQSPAQVSHGPSPSEGNDEADATGCGAWRNWRAASKKSDLHL